MSQVSEQVAVAGVSEYAARIGRALRQVGGGIVEGEVQKPKRVGGGKMLVFDLTDGEALLSCKVFARDVLGLEHEPRHGDLVQVRIERPDFYAPTGRVSVIVTAVRLAGEGELLRRREALLRQLTTEGLCDAARRKPLPAFPRAVGVIAGRSSDGMSDVIRALRDRFPPVHVVTCGALVQGAAAPRDLVDALARMQEHPLVDVIVVARGGGSVQDLVAFDDERLCRALFACSKPVITAIGHTDNVPVCNHVAHAAFTPSRSAEMAVPSAAELRQGLALAARSLRAVPERACGCDDRVAALGARLAVRAALDARDGELQRRVLGMRLAQDAALGHHERGLAEARSALREVASRVPGAEAVRLLAARLDARAGTFFADRVSALASTGRGLDGVPGALAGRALGVGDHARRVVVGTQRQLADHERDYGRALTRLARQSVIGAARRLRDAERDAHHAAAIVAARDMRSSGWLLAETDDGAPLRRAAEVAEGDRLRLHFADGRVDAIAEGTEAEVASAAGHGLFSPTEPTTPEAGA